MESKKIYFAIVLGNLEAIRTAIKSLNKSKEINILLVDFDAVSEEKENIFNLHEQLAAANNFVDPPKCDKVNLGQNAALIWSSGTTSRPKAVRKTFKCLAFALEEQTWKR